MQRFVSRFSYYASRYVALRKPLGNLCRVSRPTCSPRFQSTLAVTRVEQNPSNKCLETTWTDDSDRTYPYVWLRDNCQCPECFHESSKARRILLADLEEDAGAMQIHATAGSVEIKWSDGHQSSFKFDWLRERAFNVEDQKIRNEALKIKTEFWGAEMEHAIPRIQFDELMRNDKTLHKWLYQLESQGFVIVENAPSEIGQVQKIGKRVALLKRTNYGETFTVKNKLSASNLAYTSSTLGLHTDLPYYEYAPGMQMLHCIQQVPTEGGENQFVDGWHVASRMREMEPDLYHILSTTPVDYYDIGTDHYKFFKHYRIPVVREDEHGDIVQIAHNNQVRDSHFNIPFDRVRLWYQAVKTFNSMLYDPKYLINYKMKNGDISCFHNYRVLHGRTGYKVLRDGERHLEGAYIDWDELRSRRRVLAMEKD